ncbi:YhcN/YlaJ family sporulation lipoprotein [Cohnella sp. 56]|uniref:YhcN/YlaJ family sporulation lipoprotein n=1 Tax=Cohnella sp. 56 TaxID=3113722 RepID=UPI0030E9D60B
MKKTMLLAGALVLAIGLSGCGASSNGVKTKSKEQHMIHDSATQDMRKADELSAKIARIQGVDKATVLVNNHEAVVGLDVKSGPQSALVAQEAQQAAERALPGHRIHVTTDRNLHTRIQQIHGQMKPLDGHPVRNFSEDVAAIIRDVGRTATAPFR